MAKSLFDSTSTPLERVQLGIRFLIPQLIIFVMFLFSLAPLSFLDVGGVRPPFLLIPIYYWAVFRPNVFPPALVFGYGLLLDIISGGILGFFALIYVFMQGFIKFQRRILMGQSFFTLWGGFVAVALIDQCLKFGAATLLMTNMFSIYDFIVSAMSIILLYPVFSILMILVHRVISVTPASKKGL